MLVVEIIRNVQSQKPILINPLKYYCMTFNDIPGLTMTWTMLLRASLYHSYRYVDTLRLEA